jgi:hypothetical protein
MDGVRRRVAARIVEASAGARDMAADYIPTQDARAKGWLLTFAAGVAAEPWAYQLSQPDVVAISQAAEAFAAALAVSSNPATRTKVTVLEKDQARAGAEQLIRLYAGQIKVNAGISDPMKIAIGVRPVNRGKTRIPVPRTSPLLNVVAATNERHVLTYSDSMTPDDRAKPFGATQLQVFVHVGDRPNHDPGAAAFKAAVTKTPFNISYTHADGGKYATYFARWVSRRGEMGPWSSPVSMRVAA